MDGSSTEIVKVDARLALEPRDQAQAWRLAEIAVASRFFAAGSPEAAYVILQTGRELGLTSMQALRGIYVVNGKPVLSADLLVAVVVSSPRCEYWQPIESTAASCTIETKRRGAPAPVRKTWTIEDARRAQLVGKGTWAAYPAQMLRHRCAADLAREVFPDVALGIYTPDEIAPGEPTPEPTALHARQADERAAHYRGEPEPPEDNRVTALREDLAAMAGNIGRDLTVADVAVCWVDHQGSINADTIVEMQRVALAALPHDTSKAALQRAVAAELGRRTKAPAPTEATPVTPAPAEAPPVTPAPTEPAYSAAQAVADLGRARSRDEVDAIAVEVAALGLAPRSKARAEVSAAYKAALARLSPTPPDDGGGAPRPVAEAAVDATATPVDAEHSAAPVALAAKGTPEREAQLVASDAAWRGHLAGEGTAFAISGALAKRRKAFDAAGVLGDRTRAAMQRVQAVCALDSEQVAINVLRDPRRAYAGRAA